MWRAKPEIGWQFKWISSGRSRPHVSLRPRTDRYPRSIVPGCARARNDPFPREALLFYEGVKEARALPSPRPRFEEAVLEIHKTPRGIYFRSLVFSKREDSRSSIVGHFVNLSPGLRADAKRTSVGAPCSGIDRDRVSFLLTPGSPGFSVAQHSVLLAFNIDSLIDGR